MFFFYFLQLQTIKAFIFIGHIGMLWLVLAGCCSLGLYLVDPGKVCFIMTYWVWMSLFVVLVTSWLLVSFCLLEIHLGWLQLIVVQLGSIWFTVAQCGSLWLLLAHCGTLRFIVPHFNSLWFIACFTISRLIKIIHFFNRYN